MSDTPATPEAAPEAPAATAVPVTPDASLIAPTAAAAEPTPVAAPARPDGLPDDLWDEATGVKPEAFARLAELAAADAARREGVPASPDEYKLELAEPIVGLDGKPVAINPDDPLAKAILPALHKHGLPQAALNDVLQAYAAQEVADAKAEAEAQTAFVAAEHAKLGANHTQRTAALHGQVIAAIGADQAEAIRSQMRSADAVIALEQLVAKLQAPAIGAAPLQTPATPDLATRLYG